VPFFVGYVDDKPDVRTMDSDALRQAVMENLCWVCGQRLLRVQTKFVGTFVAGPMCLVNRTSAEPPSHADCAEWCARACPFLTNPNKVRRDKNMPEGWHEAPGIAILRNPGVTALIESHRWLPWTPHEGGPGLLFNFQRIRSVGWVKEGREATTDEVYDSIESGLPALVEVAKEEPGAMEALGADGDYPLVREVAAL
jgi:hypothetical protein